MNREFISTSEPLFNEPLVACREYQSEYIPYQFSPFTIRPYQPKKTLTRIIDAHRLFLSEKLHEIFPTAFQSPVGSFEHLLALSHTHLCNALSPADPAFHQEKLRIQVLLRFTNPTTLNYEYQSHVTPTCLRRMLPSLSASKPFLWTCVQAPGADQVAQVLAYFFSFPDRFEGLKTTFAFWRYRINELLAEDDLIPDDQVEIAPPAERLPVPRSPPHRQCGKTTSSYRRTQCTP